MSKKTQSQSENKIYQINITLTEGRTCHFEYSDRELAREQYLQYTAQGVINNQIIKKIEFVE